MTSKSIYTLILIMLAAGATIVVAENNSQKQPVTVSSAKSADSVYSKPKDAVIKSRLTDLQYEVTQNDSTEIPFENKYWNNKKEGIYVDIVSGEPLFSSKEKFKSGTGWPSFYQPLDTNNIVEKSDNILFYKRTELRSKNGDSHLGHVFNDGPNPTGLRYCINSASLRFVPVKDLESEGYGQYKKHFQVSVK